MKLIMIRKNLQIFICLFLLTLFCQPAFSESSEYKQHISLDSGPVFFIGEDIIHPIGLVISVNEISRKTIVGGGLGLGVGKTAPKEDLIINLTLLNNGSNELTINMSDFSLKLGAHNYEIFHDESNRVNNDSFTLGANTQSRVDLTFRVNKGENETPELLFVFNDSPARIICDEQLGKIVTESTLDNIPLENIAKAAKILIEAERLTAAKNLCESVLVRYPDSSSFSLLMAKIYNSVGDEELASHYIKKVDVTKMSGADEAEEAANLANSLGYSEIALSILASYDAAGLLDNKQKALLARTYYYENQLNESMEILNKLFESGYTDSNAYFTMGNIYNKKLDNQTAIYYWGKALEEQPDYSEALYNIGVGYYKSGDENKAREYWLKVLYSNPDSATLSAAETALHETER